MSFETEVLSQLQSINEMLSKLLVLAENPVHPQPRPRPERKPQTKQPPPTEEEIGTYKQQFDHLYNRWIDGDELSIQNELELLTTEELRRFADANDLNVTSKLSKEKTLALIAGRFREKKQLSMPLISRM